jgi:uncharacterized protein (DUF2461 family)
MSLKHLLTKISPREVSGSDSSDKFDYQKDWALCQLLEEHQTKADYAIAFDFHDDVIIFDSTDNPNLIDFYQVKATHRSSPWTVPLLTLQKKTIKKPSYSIIGKLYDHYTKFTKHVRTLNLVSNVNYKVEMNDRSLSNNKSNICLNDLSQNEKDNILNKVKAEYNLETLPSIEEVTFLKVSNISLPDHNDSTIGKLSKFFETISKEKYTMPSIPLVYRTLSDEIKRKNNFNPHKASTYEEIIKYKCLTKKEFDNLICHYIDQSKPKPDLWLAIESALNTNNFSMLEKRKIRTSYRKLVVDKVNNIIILKDLYDKAYLIYQEMELSGILNSSLRDCIKYFTNSYNGNPIIDKLFDESYLTAVFFDIYYEDV